MKGIQFIADHSAIGPSISSIIVSEQDVLDARNRLGLTTKRAVIKHITLSDTTGKTRGCGCALCKLRHQEFIESQLLAKYQRRVKACQPKIGNFINYSINKPDNKGHRPVLKTVLTNKRNLINLIDVTKQSTARRRDNIARIIAIVKLPK